MINTRSCTFALMDALPLWRRRCKTRLSLRELDNRGSGAGIQQPAGGGGGQVLTPPATIPPATYCFAPSPKHHPEGLTSKLALYWVLSKLVDLVLAASVTASSSICVHNVVAPTSYATSIRRDKIVLARIVPLYFYFFFVTRLFIPSPVLQRRLT